MSATVRVMGAAACAVIVWRIAAFALVLTQRDASEPSLVVHALLGAVGIAYVAIGLLVFLGNPDRVTLLFAGFCLCSGLHWGGTLELAPGSLRTGLILFYVVVSGVLGASLLLHFTLHFPVHRRIAGKRSAFVVLYAPVLVSTALAVAFLASASESAARSAAQQLFLLLHGVVSNLFAILAFGLVASGLFGRGPTGPDRGHVALMLSGMLVAWVPYLVASALGAPTDPWNLTVVALPATFALALRGAKRFASVPG